MTDGDDDDNHDEFYYKPYILIFVQMAFWINLCLGGQIFMGSGESYPESRVALIFPR